MARISATGVIVAVWILAASSLFSVITRCLVRIFKIRLRLGLSDYLVIFAWVVVLVIAILDMQIYTTGFFDLDTQAFAAAPIVTEQQVIYQQKLIFSNATLNDLSLYLPKFSFLVSYYKWISIDFPRLRVALYCLTFYNGIAFLATLLAGLLWCRPLSLNWYADFGACHNVSSSGYVALAWSLNMVSDLSIFTLPFFLLPYLKLQRHIFYATLLVFLLGAITIAVSTIRFIGYLEFQDSNAIFLIFSVELNVSIIVTCLPSFKHLISLGRRKGSSSYVKAQSRERSDATDPTPMGERLSI